MSTITDRQRRNLHEQAEAAMGKDAADTLMGYLPPMGWHDVATKQDLAAQTALLQTEIAGVRTEIAGVRTEVSQQIARAALVFAIAQIGVVASVTTLPPVVERLLR